MEKIIYKYYSEDTFEKVIEGKSMWLTDVQKSNDTSELKLVFNIVKKTFIEEFEKDKPNYIKQYFPTEEFMKFYTDNTKYIDALENKLHTQYASCFSASGDMLSQWRGYGDDGKGLSVGFAVDELPVDDFYQYKKVEYSERNQKALFRSEIHKIVNDIRQYVKEHHNIDDYPTESFMLAYNNLLVKGAFVKNYFFHEEKESRYCYWYNSGRDHVEINLKNNSIKQVIIGPKCLKSKDEINELLKNNGFIDYEIIYSKGHGVYVDSMNHASVPNVFNECKNEKEIFGKALRELTEITDCFCKQIILSLVKTSYTSALYVVADKIDDSVSRWDVADNNGILGAAFRKGTLVNIKNVKEATDYLMAYKKTKSELAVPIRANGNCIGVINLESEKVDAFSKRMEKKIEKIADDLGAIIEAKGINKRQYEHIGKVRIN